MERRNLLKIAIGVAAGAAALATAAQAAPLSPQPIDDPGRVPSASAQTHPAVISAEETARLTPEEVHWGWHHRHWGWRHRWHHRHRRHW